MTWSTLFILLQNLIASFSQSVFNTTAVFFNSSTAALDYTDLSLLKTFANNSALSIFTSDSVTNVFTFLPVPSTFQNLASESKLLVSTAVN